MVKSKMIYNKRSIILDREVIAIQYRLPTCVQLFNPVAMKLGYESLRA